MSAYFVSSNTDCQETKTLVAPSNRNKPLES